MSARKRERDQAVAVQYERETRDAPTVVAKGEGFIARKIVERALEFRVYAI